MGRQGLMDDSGYHGFDECSCYEECTNNIIEHLLEPYGVESIEELIAKTKADAIMKFAEWLSEKGYLTEIEYDEDEDMDGNIVWNEWNISLDTKDVVAEYFESLKEKNNK